jgi:hypothetical protein
MFAEKTRAFRSALSANAATGQAGYEEAKESHGKVFSAALRYGNGEALVYPIHCALRGHPERSDQPAVAGRARSRRTRWNNVR